MSTGLSWHDYRDAAALSVLEREWWGLWHRCSSATPFQSPAWLIPWWHAFAPGTMFVLAARSPEQQLVALAPFYLETGALGRRLLPIGISLSDYEDILVDDAWSQSICSSLLANLVDREKDWQTCELGELAPDASALRLDPAQGCEDFVQPSSACPVLDLPTGASRPADFLPSRKRRSLRLAEHRAARRGRVEVIEAQTGSVTSMLETLIRLHGARWQRRSEPGLLADARVQNFQRESVPRLHAAGLLRLCELRIGGCLASVYYGMQHGHRAYAYLMGFDPDCEFVSPGTLLLAHAIGHAMHSGATEFHFLRGDEPYKYSWGAQDRWNRRRIIRRMQIYARAS